MDKSFLIFLAIPIFFVMILIEYTYGKLKGKNNYRLNDTITSINIGLLSRFPTILNLGVQGLVYAYVASYLSLNILPEIQSLHGCLPLSYMIFYITGCIVCIMRISYYGGLM